MPSGTLSPEVGVLKVSAKDFGPIAEGSVELKPLTVFVGQSNTGKSYFAMLVYCLMQAIGNTLAASYDQIPRRELRADKQLASAVSNMQSDIGLDDATVQAFNDWISTFDKNGNRTEYTVASLPGTIGDQIDRIVKASLSLIELLFKRELQKCHGGILSTCRKATDTCLRIELTQQQPPLKVRFTEGLDSLISDSDWDVSQWHLDINEHLIGLYPEHANALPIC